MVEAPGQTSGSGVHPIPFWSYSHGVILHSFFSYTEIYFHIVKTHIVGLCLSEMLLGLRAAGCVGNGAEKQDVSDDQQSTAGQ